MANISKWAEKEHLFREIIKNGLHASQLQQGKSILYWDQHPSSKLQPTPFNIQNFKFLETHRPALQFKTLYLRQEIKIGIVPIATSSRITRFNDFRAQFEIILIMGNLISF